jgi:pimeloyl-ACP methyl ester carboxylesterase
MTASDLAVVRPAPGSALGLGSLAREAKSLFLSFVTTQPQTIGDFPRGDGRTVLVIPGFFAGDWATTAHLRAFLLRLGYRVETAGIVFNIGPTPQLIARLEARLLALSEDGAIDLVGQSFGGVLARDLAARHPGRVRKVVTLCSPVRIPITTPLAPLVRVLAGLYDRSWMARRHNMIAPLAVPVTALHTEEDGVVDWRECLQDPAPGYENVRVSGAHVTIGTSPSALAAVAHALSG